MKLNMENKYVSSFFVNMYVGFLWILLVPAAPFIKITGYQILRPALKIKSHRTHMKIYHDPCNLGRPDPVLQCNIEAELLNYTNCCFNLDST